MRILDRYFSVGLFGALFFCLCLFFSLFITIDAFNNLDEFLKHSASLKVILAYYLYWMPAILVQITPIALLVSVLFVLGNMNRHYEIMALRASGLSGFQLLSPYLLIAALISISIFLFNDRVVPQASINSAAIRDGLIKKGKKSFEKRSLSNVTFYGRGKTMIYAREFELSNDALYDLVVLEDSPKKTTQTKTTARKAVYNQNQWLFTDVMIQVLNRRGDLVREPEFYDTLTKTMPVRPEDFVHEASQIDFMTTKELREYIENLGNQSRKLTRKLLVDLHYRVAFPFFSLVLVLIAAPLAMQSRNHGGALTGIGVSLGVVVAYYWVVSISLALGKGGFLPPVFAAWFANVLFAGLGIYWIKNS